MVCGCGSSGYQEMMDACGTGAPGFLVSNDEMRDHIFQLLAPKFFGKWKQRHQLRYKIADTGAALLQYPAPFTVCTQHLPGPGAWLLPLAEGDAWLCAQPES